MSKYRPIVRLEQAAETAGTATVAELREVAEDLGIDHKGLKKPELEAAIAAKNETPEPAVPADPASAEVSESASK